MPVESSSPHPSYITNRCISLAEFEMACTNNPQEFPPWFMLCKYGTMMSGHGRVRPVDGCLCPLCSVQGRPVGYRADGKKKQLGTLMGALFRALALVVWWKKRYSVPRQESNYNHRCHFGPSWRRAPLPLRTSLLSDTGKCDSRTVAASPETGPRWARSYECWAVLHAQSMYISLYL